MMPAGHHSNSDSTLLPLPKSAITWFGGIFARLREKCLLGCWTICSPGEGKEKERKTTYEMARLHRERHEKGGVGGRGLEDGGPG